MKRLIAGATLAGATILMPHSAEAQTGDICDVVYDEANTGDSSIRLRDEIGQYALADVEIHVQILKSAASHGINSGEEAVEFAEELAEDCGWLGEDFVNILVAVDPVGTDIYISDGQAAADIPRTTREAAADALYAALGRNEKVQPSVADALDFMNPYDTPDTQPQNPPNTTPPAPSNQESGASPDIPLKEILFGVGASIGAGLGIARGVRAVSIRKLRTSMNSRISTTMTEFNDAVDTAKSRTSNLHDDDAPELRAQLETTSQQQANLGEVRDAVDSTYAAEYKSVWPDKPRLIALSADIDEKLTASTQNAQALVAEVDRIDAFAKVMEAKVPEFDANLDETRTTIDTLMKDGWDVGHYQQDLDNFTAVSRKIAELRQTHYVEKPGELLHDNEEPLATLLKNIVALPERRETVDLHHGQYAATITTGQATTSTAQQALLTMREKFDHSCINDIADHDTQLDAVIAKQKEIQVSVGKELGQKTLKSVEASEALNAEFNHQTAQISELAQAIHARVAEIDQIIEQLPDNLAAIRNQLETTHEFSYNTYRDDVEEDTRTSLRLLEGSFADFEQTEVGADKPAYLKLANEIKVFESSAAEVHKAAKTQKEQMDSYRSTITTVVSDNRESLSDLLNYINRESSDIDADTRARAQSIALLHGDTTANRSGLRDQVNDLTSQKTLIQSVLNDAKQEVRKKEAARAKAAADARAEASRIANARIAATRTITNISRNSGSSGKGGHSTRGF